MIITMRNWGLFFTFVCAAVLAAVYISQYGFGLQPCHLCHFERIPYFIGIGLGLMLVFVKDTKIQLVLLALLAVTFVYSTGLSVFHVGVEHKWWTYNSACAGDTFRPGASTEEILAALKAAPTVRCDAAVEFLFGLSMAFYNALTSFVLTLAALYALGSSRSVYRG